MSEYQYYEFRAIDRPLTKKQMDEVGEYSTRAEITPTRFANEYHYGDFRGDALKFIERYYDAMIYVANWGTHRFIFRVPADLVDRKVVEPYCVGDSAELSVKGNHLIFDLTSNTDDHDDYDVVQDSADSMSSLISVRAELLAGDLRPLYIAWLAGAREDEPADDALEPPVPPGLKKLTASQIDLAAFLRVDDDLLSVAAATSADLAAQNVEGDFSAWLTALPTDEKDELLIALTANAEPLLPTRLRQRFQAQNAALVNPTGSSRRRVSQLLEEADHVESARDSAAAEATARKHAKLEAQAARERSAHLDRVAERGEEPWKEIENWVASKNQVSYDAAIKLLKDLRDIALREGASTQYALRVHLLMERHAKKSSFRDRVKKSNLIPQPPGVA